MEDPGPSTSGYRAVAPNVDPLVVVVVVIVVVVVVVVIVVVCVSFIFRLFSQ